MRLRLIAPVLLVLAATAGSFVLTWMGSSVGAWFVLATGLAGAAFDTHRAHIMRKLDLETRAELVQLALANGLIGPS